MSRQRIGEDSEIPPRTSLHSSSDEFRDVGSHSVLDGQKGQSMFEFATRNSRYRVEFDLREVILTKIEGSPERLGEPKRGTRLIMEPGSAILFDEEGEVVFRTSYLAPREVGEQVLRQQGGRGIIGRIIDAAWR